MPWDAKDAKHSTKKAKSAKDKRQWAHVANSERRSGKSDGEAKIIANGVIARRNRFGYRPR